LTFGYKITAIICTYNPHAGRLARVVDALSAQTLPPNAFEIVLVDNASNPPVTLNSAPENLRIVHEPKQGLTYARLRGVAESSAPVLVFIDDDNVIMPNYLQVALEAFAADARLGALGGRIYPLWEGGPPPEWTEEFFNLLALRDFGDTAVRAVASEPLSYPAIAPVGAGMAVRRTALSTWITSASGGGGPTDRKGGSLASGGDNDMILHLLRAGFAVAYEPRLGLGHIIPPDRLTHEYLGRLAEAIMVSWVATLNSHGIRPWSPSSPVLTLLRLLRLRLSAKPWKSDANYVRWKQRQGLIHGRAQISRSIVIRLWD
jgi:hypothetical protein